MIECLGCRCLSQPVPLRKLDGLPASLGEEEVEGAGFEVGRVKERLQILVGQLAAFQSSAKSVGLSAAKRCNSLSCSSGIHFP